MMNILVFHIGALGDTIAALPSFWAVRENFQAARITLLYEHGAGNVCARDVVEGAGIFDEYIPYSPKSRSSILNWVMGTFRLINALRLGKYNLVVYLTPSVRSGFQILRDKVFFSLSGVPAIIGLKGFSKDDNKRPLTASMHEADLILERLKHHGLKVPSPGFGRMDFNVGRQEILAVDKWKALLMPDGNRSWIGIAPASKMPAKVWPLENFKAVVQALIREFNVWPVVFGGSGDKVLGDELVKYWECGHNAAGVLNVRQSACAMKRCKIYIGNDTGTMHLAAAMGLPCAAIFSARSRPGRWFPYGNGHVVFRANISCEGCELVECVDRGMACIRMIKTEAVLDRCRPLLSSALNNKQANL